MEETRVYCDRCHAIIINKTAVPNFCLFKSKYRISKVSKEMNKLDLCQSCLSSLDRWMNFDNNTVKIEHEIEMGKDAIKTIDEIREFVNTPVPTHNFEYSPNKLELLAKWYKEHITQLLDQFKLKYEPHSIRDRYNME